MSGIKLSKLYKQFPNGFEAVKHIDLDISDREFIVLVGPSGCGKTTTLRMIAGLEEATDGEIYIGEKLVNTVAPKNRDIAMVFQNYALYPHMTVYKNMAIGLSLRKTPKMEIDRRVKEAAKMLGIEALLDRKPKQLSGGEKQRVAMGRAIVREPKAFLMDEPLSNLDAKLRVQMRAEISKLHQKLKTTFIYVTHDQTEAMTLGTRIVVMKDGVIQQVDTPQNLFNNPLNIFVAGFIGSPQMNFFDVKIVESGGVFLVELAGRSFRLSDELSKTLIDNGYINKNITLGIRPNDVYVDPAFIEKNPEHTLEAQVELVERLGSETYLYLVSQDYRFISCAKADCKIKIDDVVKVAFDFSKLHFFDNQHGERII